ncbi:MAG: SdrD B-like domain-containing protein [Anaerohalosphaeraceae bacterium]
MYPQKLLVTVISLFCLTLAPNISADTLIYNNATPNNSFAPGSYYEIFDYGTTAGGFVSKFTFGYSSASTTSVIVQFYQYIDINNFDVGYPLKQITINNLPATGGVSRYHEYVLPEADRFTLPNGYFGYSITCTSSTTKLVLASGGAGNENELWEYYEDWIYGWGWYPFWFNGTPWAGLYMKVYTGPSIDAITCDISGCKFDDRDGDGFQDAGEPTMSGWELYLDTNSDGICQPSEPNTVTDPNGYYLFENMPSPATYRVREINKDGWTQTWPGSAWNYQYTLSTEPNTLYLEYNFGNTTASTKYGGGQGTSTAPYLIYTAEHMNQIGLNKSDWSKHFKLMADIDMSAYTGTQYNIIGNASTKFTGTFDGNGHVIRNLTYSTYTVVMYIGLFGYTQNATIINLGIENVFLYTGGSYAGGLTAWQEAGTITDCYSTGMVVASSTSTYVGGLVGRSSGTITRCSSEGTISATSTVAAAYAGGLVGFLTSNTLSSACSTASVTASSASNAYAGGLAGLQTASTITSCFSTGPVHASSPTAYAGGQVGFQGAGTTLQKCYSTGLVTAAAATAYQGGLLGSKSGDVTNSFWDTQTSGQSTSAGGTGKTTAQMQTQATFANAGWDFTNTWRMCDGTNYPRLQWEPLLAGDFICPDGVSTEDLSYYAGQWLKNCSPANAYCGGADMDQSGQVNLADFSIFAGYWLEEI